MNQSSVWERIECFNRGRDPDRLNQKYKVMQRDPFAFLRGTAHLFYQDWPKRSKLNDAPLAWICGDLHLENFGAYKGDNRLGYFDINDFDEAVLAPCTWDLARILCSLLVGAQTLGIEYSQALALCEGFLDTYSRELVSGKARWIERSTASGMIRDLLKNLKKRSRPDLLKERTIEHGGGRLLRVDNGKALAASDKEKRRITRLIDRFAAGQPQPEFFRVLDVARRIAGTGSLGLERFVVLVHGKGAKREYLLDLKYQPGSSLSPYLTVQQPAWRSEAERVATLQHRGQAIAPAFLSALGDGKRSYLLKEMMPQQDRLELRHWNGKPQRLLKVVYAMAALTAWQHMRTGGWRGSAIADQWQSFGRRTAWRRPLLEYVQVYSRQVQSDWRSFCADFADNL
ncbi:MAG: DUF2252 domain-containing protein [Methylomonas sp.]